MGHDALAAFLGFISGATMAVAVSCVWVVLLLPSRLQHVLGACGTPNAETGLLAGVTLAALALVPGFRLRLPGFSGYVPVALGGAFTGMLASALGEITEVVPVLLHRFRVEDTSKPVRWVMLIAKTLGAVLGCILYPL